MFLEYDDVMNLQRKAIYDERNAILDGKDLSERIPEIISDAVESNVLEWCSRKDASDDWDIDSLNNWLAQMTGDTALTVDSFDHEDDVDTLIEQIAECLQERYDAKAEQVGPVFKDIQSQVMLRFIDTRWMSHLQEMDYLKSGIGLRAYGHRDPLVEYREEAHRAFAALTESIYRETICVSCYVHRWLFRKFPKRKRRSMVMLPIQILKKRSTKALRQASV